jgi:1,4-dihydroxy-2-naphthoyl-CoA hydrolase
MKIWKTEPDLRHLNQIGQDNMAQHLGLEFTAFGDDYLEAKMPVDHRTKQPAGLLHGGASVVLAETLGSVASYLCAAQGKKCVGIEINANHLKSVTEGFVTGRVRPIRLGRSLHVWTIEIHNSAADLVCVSRLTVAIL